MNIFDAKSIIVYYDGTIKTFLSYELTKLNSQIKPTHLLNVSGKDDPNVTLSKINSVDEITKLEKPYVLLAISMVNENEQNKAQEIVAKLVENGISYDYMPHLYKKQTTTGRILKVLGLLDYVNPITKNEIHITATTGAFFVFNFFENSSCSKIVIEKNSFACDGKVEINVHHSHNTINIKNNVFIFEDTQIITYGNSAVVISNESYIEKKCKIICGNQYTRIDGETNDVLVENNQILIGKHVRIEEDSKICTGSIIGDGCVVSAFSVVYGFFDNCCLLYGNPATIVRKNVSWTNEKILDNNEDEFFYVVKSRTAFKYFLNRVNVVLCGCCVEYKIMEYCRECKAEDIIFQNPISTMFSNPLHIEKKDIVIENNSDYLRRNLHSEFNKLFLDRINKAKAKFFIFDIADIRFNYFEFEKPTGVRIYRHKNAVLTLNNSNEGYKYTAKSYSDISMGEWYQLLDRFIDTLIERFGVDNIIMVKIPIAKYYYENGEKVYFSDVENDIKFETLIRMLEEYVASKLRPENIIETKMEVVSDINFKLGGGALHYTPEIYKDLALQVDAIVRKIESNEREV